MSPKLKRACCTHIMRFYLAPTPNIATGMSSPRPSTNSSQSSGQCRDSNNPPPPITNPLKRLTCDMTIQQQYNIHHQVPRILVHTFWNTHSSRGQENEEGRQDEIYMKIINSGGKIYWSSCRTDPFSKKKSSLEEVSRFFLSIRVLLYVIPGTRYTGTWYQVRGRP